MWCIIGEEGFKVFKQLRRLHDVRVLMAAIDKLQSNNLILTSQAELARELGIASSSVCLAYKRLQQSGILLKHQKNGVNFYYLNPELVWKDTRTARTPAFEALHQFRSEQAKTVPPLETTHRE